MAKTKASNLTRVEESLSGKEIEALNGLEPGLGAKVHRLLTTLGNVQGAQAGHQGTVVIAEQKPTDATGTQPDSMQLQGGKIGDASPAERDDQYVTLGQMRSYLTCENLAGILADCIEDEIDLTGQGKPACSPTGLGHPKSIDTGLTTHFAVEVQNEFVYVLGV